MPRRVGRHALRLHPHCWSIHSALGRALTALGQYGPARSYYRRASLLYKGPRRALLSEMAYLEAAADNRDGACNLLSRLQGLDHGISLVSLAQIHAALGNTSRALDCIDEACLERDWYVSALKQDSWLDPLRTNPRFQRALRGYRIVAAVQERPISVPLTRRTQPAGLFLRIL